MSSTEKHPKCGKFCGHTHQVTEICHALAYCAILGLESENSIEVPRKGLSVYSATVATLRRRKLARKEPCVSPETFWAIPTGPTRSRMRAWRITPNGGKSKSQIHRRTQELGRGRDDHR